MRTFEQKQKNIAKSAQLPMNSRKSSKSEDTFFKPVIQAKLKVGGSNDKYEREADAVTDKVVSDKKAPGVQRKEEQPLNIQKKCTNCEEEKKVQKKETVDTGEQKREAPALVNEVLQSPGKKLDTEVRRFMEPRFGYSFENVKVHTDYKAAKSANAIQAKAYTSGNNIVFAAGKYNPGTTGGKKLIAHELTHVLQQSSNRKRVQKKAYNLIQTKPAVEPSSKEKPQEELQKEPAETIQRQLAQPQAQPQGHPRAMAALANMEGYRTNENILFDFWGGDCRDNNKNGVTDSDRRENVGDGSHFGRSFPGFSVHRGVVCAGGFGGTHTNAVDFTTSTAVKYRVCADLVSKAFHDAGTGMPISRTVAGIINHITSSRHFQFWEVANFRGSLLPGDIFCSFDGHHGHIAIVTSAGTLTGAINVIHLPGQSQLILQGVYDPTVLNDVRREPWPSFRARYGVGRYIG